MKILIKSAKIIDSQSPFHQQIKDILVENGIITDIADNINLPKIQVIEGENLHISAGWIDMRVQARDPGFEYKEDLESLLKAAAYGGFTEIVTLPNTKPVVQTKEAISYYKRLTTNELVEIFPTAAVTKNCEGKDFTEMYDLQKAGAVAFTDGENTLWNADILLKTLQYLSPIGAILMNRPEEPTLTHFGQMNEGVSSTLLGMKGIPAAAEELMIMRDLKLLEYAEINSTKSVLHFSTISTEKAVDLIREAKKKGMPVSCDIAAHQLAFTDDDLMDFDTNLKVNPPFRSKNDIKALQKGLADGTIDVIVSDHSPQDEESKNLEFDLAEFGIIGLETAFAVANTFGKLSVEKLVEKFTINPRQLLNLKCQQASNQAISLEKGKLANLTIFDPTAEWTFTEKGIQSKSKNSPFIGKNLIGKVIGVINKGRFFLSER
jgi:dihydroorotase